MKPLLEDIGKKEVRMLSWLLKYKQTSLNFFGITIPSMSLP
jgi:hypothetical protein